MTKGHLYRLGGDEFVLFYLEKQGFFEDQATLRSYYQEILQKALLSYTMPNIEEMCTLSMGLALFPAHGDTLSELLRKADIALYKAKAEGRNRVVLFEDKYDAAKNSKTFTLICSPYY